MNRVLTVIPPVILYILIVHRLHFCSLLGLLLNRLPLDEKRGYKRKTGYSQRAIENVDDCIVVYRQEHRDLVLRHQACEIGGPGLRQLRGVKAGDLGA